MRNGIFIGVAFLVACALSFGIGLSTFVVHAEDDDDEAETPKLAEQVNTAGFTLERGLKASSSSGTPLSGKFEIERGVFQLSIYTQKGNEYFEVVLDPKSGAVTESEAIIGYWDMDDAANQSHAMSAAKMTLEAAVEKALKANPGFRAVSVSPEALKGGGAVAKIVLVKDADFRKVTEKLN